MASTRRQVSVLVIAAILLAILLTILVGVLNQGSRNDQPASPPPADSSPPASSPQPDQLSTGQQDLPSTNIQDLDLGQTAVLKDSTGTALLSLTVHAATPASQCPTGTEGSFLVLDVSAEVEEDAAESLATTGNSAEAGEFFFPTMSQTFSVFTSDGAREEGTSTSAAQECYPPEEYLAPFIAPGESRRGVIVLESSATTGQIAYNSAMLSGWLWNF